MTPSVTHVDKKAWPALQAELEAIAAIERALMDEPAGRIWIMAESGAEDVPLELAVHEALRGRGIDPASIPVEIVSRPGRGTRRRIRLVRVERSGIGERLIKVRVTLEWADREFAAEAEGEFGAPIELRTAGTATIKALREVVGDQLEVRLVGVKEIRAFDADLLIASLWVPGSPPKRCVGAVVDTGDHTRTAAMAVLHGLNRMIGNFLDSD